MLLANLESNYRFRRRIGAVARSKQIDTQSPSEVTAADYGREFSRRGRLELLLFPSGTLELLNFRTFLLASSQSALAFPGNVPTHIILDLFEQVKRIRAC
jgi:hypothetical protein